MGQIERVIVATQLTGTAQRVWRAFGRVRFTVAWQGGETETITVPKRQFDAAIRKGDTIGTIVADPSYTAEDLIRWNTQDPSLGPPVKPPTVAMTPDIPPEERYYDRIGGPAR